MTILRSLLLAYFLNAFSIATFAQPESAWISLFNGLDFSGWKMVDPPVDAKVEEGCIVIHKTPHTSRHAYIRTENRYKDFIFEIEFRHDRKMDSGILFRGEAAPDTAYTGLFGYMVKVDPRPARLWTGGIFLDYGLKYEWLQPLEGDERARSAEKPAGEWNHLRIEAIGDEIKVWLNDIPTNHLLDDRYHEGYIALKIHHQKNGREESQAQKAAFRNPRIIVENPKAHAKPIDLPLKDTRS